jgi:hypothetical protein
MKKCVKDSLWTNLLSNFNTETNSKNKFEPAVQDPNKLEYNENLKRLFLRSNKILSSEGWNFSRVKICENAQAKGFFLSKQDGMSKPLAFRLVPDESNFSFACCPIKVVLLVPNATIQAIGTRSQTI